MNADFRDSGVNEATKGAVHGAVLVLALMCGVYNTCAWLRRREPHLAVNAVVYNGLVLFEGWQVVHHVHRKELA